MPFSLTEVVLDPDLAEAVSILRSTGQYGPGGWQNQTTTIPAYGVVTIAEGKTLQQVPEGDKVTGALEFNSAQRIYQTSEQGQKLSDILVWRGVKYKVLQVFPWADFGFWKAVMVRMPGA
jgi:hypothetical protein